MQSKAAKVFRLRLSNSSVFARDVLKLVGGTTAAQAIGFLVVPLLARIYSPDAFGALSVFGSITTILIIVSCLRYEYAILLPEQEQDASNLLILCVGLAFLVSVVAAMIVTFCGGKIAAVLNVPDLAPVMWMIPVVVFAGGLLQALSQWSSRKRKYGRVSFAQASKAGCTSISQLALGVGGTHHLGGLVMGVVVGGLAASIGLAGQVWIADRRSILSNFSIKVVNSVLRRYRKFPLFDIWGALFNSVSWQLPVFMLAFFFSDTVVGNYGMASRLVYFPMSLIGSSIGQVFYQRTSQLRARQEPFTGVVESVLERMIALLMYPALLMTFMGKTIILVLLGPTWADAGSYVQILGLWSFFWFISSPLHTVFLVLERQQSLLVAQTVILVSRLLSLAVGGLLRDVQLALVLFSASGVLVYGSLLIWICLLSGLQIHRLWQGVRGYFLLSIPGVLLVSGAQRFLSVYTLLILGIGAVSVIVYYYVIFRKHRHLFKV